jgi:SAM-dependent methyltransferase
MGMPREPLALPPDDLAKRVFAAIDDWSDPTQAYLDLGKETAEQIRRLLPADWSFAGKRILDFGSGAGRTLRHFTTEAHTAEFWSCDTHEPSIAWLQENLCPPFHALCSPVNPPSGMEHESFDLIYAVSVFTHLTDNSAPWLLELHRLLKPGGLLIATFMGRWSSEYFANEPWVEDRVGMNVLGHNNDWESGGPAVLMSEWWVREHWGRAFDILEIDPQFQNFSWVLARRRTDSVTVEDLLRPADDLREFKALSHNVRQVENELARELEHQAALYEEHYQKALRDQAADYEQRITVYQQAVESYESSTSWRATRPLRRWAGWLRGRSSDA